MALLNVDEEFLENNPKVCSKHFEDEDFEASNQYKMKKLKKTSVPSKLLQVNLL